MAKVRLKGLKTFEARMNAKLKQIKGHTKAGLKEAGLILQRESQERVPVERGPLRASAYTRNHQTEPMAVVVGYSASYALAIHENVGQVLAGKPRPSGLGVYWGPQGRPKFLTSAFVDKEKEMLAAIVKHAKRSIR